MSSDFIEAHGSAGHYLYSSVSHERILQSRDNKMLSILKVVLQIRRECKSFLTTSSQTNYRQAKPKWILFLRTSELYSTYSKHIRGLKLIEVDWIWKDINREDMKNLLKMNLSKLLWNSATGQSLVEGLLWFPLEKWSENTGFWMEVKLFLCRCAMPPGWAPVENTEGGHIGLAESLWQIQTSLCGSYLIQLPLSRRSSD